jgi:hypothetical protein
MAIGTPISQWCPAEPRGTRLEPELFYGAGRLWIRCHRVVQHGTRQWRSIHGAGIAQVIPTKVAVIVSTPALQTNFSPTSAAFWQQVYLDMATV